jgi:glycosyl hydrolase family 134
MGKSGSYTVPGLGARKAQLLAAGATLGDMAIAMLESDKMLADYVYGDAKAGDAANFGIFKQNWMMIRAAWTPFAALGEKDYHRGAALNSNLALDIQVLHASQSKYGMASAWWAGHRNGASGLRSPNTPDIQNYRNAVKWIEAQLSSKPSFRTDNTRFYVEVVAI